MIITTAFLPIWVTILGGAAGMLMLLRQRMQSQLQPALAPATIQK